MEILGKILGNSARVKIMRLFLLNRNTNFSKKEIEKRSRVDQNGVRREVNLLHSVDFIKKHSDNWIFNPSFKYTLEMENLLLGSDFLNEEMLLENFKKAGRVKLLLASGLFIKNGDSRVDIFIVGNKLNRAKIQEEIRKTEAEIGTELVYAVFDMKEFIYRLSMNDKLVRDVLDFPHKVIFQAKELSTESLKSA